MRTGDGPAERTGLLQIVQDFKPTIVLLDKPVGTGLRSWDIRAWRAVSDFVFVVADVDAYHRWSKSPPRAAKVVTPHADLVFVPGSGSLLRNYRTRGRARSDGVRSPYDPASIGLCEITGYPATRESS